MAETMQMSWHVAVDDGDAPALSGTCHVCAGPLPAGSTHRRMYCSTACRSKAQNARPHRKAQRRKHANAWRQRVHGESYRPIVSFECAHCKRVCRPGVDVDGRASKFCSQSCKSKYHAGRPRSSCRYVESFRCASCHRVCRPGVDVGKRATKFCSTACKTAAQNTKMRNGARWRVAQRKLDRMAAGQGPSHVFECAYCRQCGTAFVAIPVHGTFRFCSASCSNRHHGRAAHHRRRVALQGRPSDKYALRDVLERDGYVCQLCGGVIDPDAPPNTREQASVDHIVPVSRGGADTWDNVQAAHRGCNSRKGNRVECFG